MKLSIKPFFITIALLSLAACSSEDEFIDNSDEINKEFGVTNKIDESWVNSIKSSELALVFDRVEKVEYAKSNGRWEEYDEGSCASYPGILPYYRHWTPIRIVFKDGVIYSHTEEYAEFQPEIYFFDYCRLAYKNNSGLTPVDYCAVAEFGSSDLTIKCWNGIVSIVELSDNNLIIKEEHEICYGLAKYRFSPYFEFEDGNIHGDEICFIGDSRIECNTKFFEEFKKHFGDKVNLPKLVNDGDLLVIDGEVTKGDIDMSRLENYLRKEGYIL